jgi:flavin-dependent dehydrogenase
MIDVAIIGGGLAGLICSIRLSRTGIRTILIEKRSYPAHKVCGEYLSNEVFPFLEREKLLDNLSNYPQINQFQLSSENGKMASVNLKMGGFGISRYKLDFELYQKAKEAGVQIVKEEAIDIHFEENENQFLTRLGNGETISSVYVIGAYGKRSRLDKSMDRAFTLQRSPWVAIKYHLKYDVPSNSISLHNFPGGYCGISRVEDGITNLCYLTKRENLLQHRDIRKLEVNLLSKNPHLKTIFSDAEFLFKNPMVINEVSFTSKSTVEEGVIMIGDSAGMVAPLCGNGMAMAIHSGKILSDILISHYNNGNNRSLVQRNYTRAWNTNFRRRLWIGRQLQQMFGKLRSANRLIGLMRNQPRLAQYLINKTHGEFI